MKLGSTSLKGHMKIKENLSYPLWNILNIGPGLASKLLVMLQIIKMNNDIHLSNYCIFNIADGNLYPILCQKYNFQ